MLHVHEKNFTSHILNYEKTILTKKSQSVTRRPLT